MRVQVRLVHLMAMIVAAALASSLFAAVHRARTAARTAQCVCTPKFLMLMLWNDVDRTGRTRRAVEFDGSGRPMQSWRTALWLPEFGSPVPYDSSIPWDAPANLPAADDAPSTFVCPNAQSSPTGYTNVAAIVDGDACSLDLMDPRLRAGGWVVLVEVPESNIRWTEPRDVSPSEIAAYSTPNDPGGFAVGLSDGSVRRLSRDEILANWARAKAALRAAKSPGG